MPHIVLEACVDSVEGALTAQQAGADRVELCAGLVEGGLTPSAAAIELARRHLAIALHVLVRPRGGDFCYSDLEFAVMRRDIEVAKSLGADGIVFGALQPDATIDVGNVQPLIQLARPLSITFHRAFDMTADPFAALDTLMSLGVERVLTSGQEATALAGAARIADLVRHAAGRITLMAGGGIGEHTVAQLVRMTRVSEVHMSGRIAVESPMTVRNPRVSMGSPHLPEYQRVIASAARIRACRDLLDALSNDPDLSTPPEWT